MKDYQAFYEEVVEKLQKRYDETYTFREAHVSKNNGIIRHGIVIQRKDEIVAPTIYLDLLYDAYQTGMPMSLIIDEVCKEYESREPIQFDEFDVSKFSEWDAVKDRVVCQVVNKGMNQELLMTHPYMEVLDLAIVFLVYVENRKDGQMTIAISNHHMQMWGVSLKELKDVAEANTRHLYPEKLIRIDELMNQLIEELSGDSLLEELSVSRLEEASKMYVLTNERKIRGAVTIFYPGVMKAIAEKLGSDVVILPSSLHEVILLRRDVEPDFETLKKMVCEVNEEQVVLEERLSNHVYLYVKDKDEFEIVA